MGRTPYGTAHGTHKQLLAEGQKIIPTNMSHLTGHCLWHNDGASCHWAMWAVGDSGVKVQYKLAQTHPVNVARMRDDPTSVIGRNDILHFCR